MGRGVNPLVFNLCVSLRGVSGHLHASTALPPRKSPGTRRKGIWVDPRDGMDVLGKQKTYFPYPDSNTGQSIYSGSQSVKSYLNGDLFRKVAVAYFPGRNEETHYNHKAERYPAISRMHVGNRTATFSLLREIFSSYRHFMGIYHNTAPRRQYAQFRTGKPLHRPGRLEDNTKMECVEKVRHL